MMPTPTTTKSHTVSSPTDNSSSSSSSSSSSPSSPSSPLTPLISSTREAVSDTLSSVSLSEENASRYYNSRIADPLNSKISVFRRSTRELRNKYPKQIFIGTVGITAIASAPWGRFAMIRNAALAALGIGWILFPATTTGLIIVANDRIRGTQQRTPSQWREQGEIAVRRSFNSAVDSTRDT